MFGIGESDTNAISLLKADHREVDELFKQYESQKKEGATAAKVRTAQLICVALSVHAAIADGSFSGTSQDFRRLTGREPVSVREFLETQGDLLPRPLTSV